MPKCGPESRLGIRKPHFDNAVSRAESSADDGKFGFRVWKKAGELLPRMLPNHFPQRFLGPPHAWMNSATAIASVSPSVRRAYETNLLARSNRTATRLIPIPTRIKGNHMSLYTQTNWRTQAETQQEFGICRIEGLKPCNDQD